MAAPATWPVADTAAGRVYVDEAAALDLSPR
jgi:hypothetical protein